MVSMIWSWLRFQLVGKRKLRNLSDDQKDLLQALIDGKTKGHVVNKNHPAVKDLIDAGILGNTTRNVACDSDPLPASK